MALTLKLSDNHLTQEVVYEWGSRKTPQEENSILLVIPLINSLGISRTHTCDSSFSVNLPLHSMIEKIKMAPKAIT